VYDKIPPKADYWSMIRRTRYRQYKKLNYSSSESPPYAKQYEATLEHKPASIKEGQPGHHKYPTRMNDDNNIINDANHLKPSYIEQEHQGYYEGAAPDASTHQSSFRKYR
jgi:hypothetical protein